MAVVFMCVSILSNGIHESVVVYNVDDIYKYMTILGFYLFFFFHFGGKVITKILVFF